MAVGDGIISVADSRQERFEATQRCYSNCCSALSKLRFDPRRIPFAFQFNQRDAKGAVTPDLLDDASEVKVPSCLACAIAVYQVFATLDWVTQQVLEKSHLRALNAECLTMALITAVNRSIQSSYTRWFTGLKGSLSGEIFNGTWILVKAQIRQTPTLRPLRP